MAGKVPRGDWKSVPTALLPPEKHFTIVAKEVSEMVKHNASARRTVIVRKRIAEIQRESPTSFGDTPIDWETELQGFGDLPYPDYYRQPFHSVPGGWLSKRAATVNREAMQAIYKDAHRNSCMGLRKILSMYVPRSAMTVVDVGTGDGDGAASTARYLPGAKVIGIDASPFMIIVGRRQNRDCPNLEFRHLLAEKTGIASNSIDAVTICLVLHECENGAKRNILKEALRILKPGGTIVLADTPQSDLFTFRGFYEPWKEQWLDFEPVSALQGAGFEGVEDKGILGGDGKVLSVQEHVGDWSKATTDNRLFCFTARKPIGARL
jgi:SAM-dependent methyltransferase